MKLISLLSRFAAGAFAAFLLGLVFTTQIPALFAVAISALVLLIVAGDYAAPSLRSSHPSARIVSFTAPPPVEEAVKLAA